MNKREREAREHYQKNKIFVEEFAEGMTPKELSLVAMAQDKLYLIICEEEDKRINVPE